MLTSDERFALIRLGIDKAEEVYNEAEAIARLGYWNLTGNRLYYAVFHMARALLLDKGIAPTLMQVSFILSASILSQQDCWINPTENYSLACMNCGNQAITMTALTPLKMK